GTCGTGGAGDRGRAGMPAVYAPGAGADVFSHAGRSPPAARLATGARFQSARSALAGRLVPGARVWRGTESAVRRRAFPQSGGADLPAGDGEPRLVVRLRARRGPQPRRRTRLVRQGRAARQPRCHAPHQASSLVYLSINPPRRSVRLASAVFAAGTNFLASGASNLM